MVFVMSCKPQTLFVDSYAEHTDKRRNTKAHPSPSTSFYLAFADVIDADAITKALDGAIARAVLYAVSQPDDVDVNEMIVRPTASAF